MFGDYANLRPYPLADQSVDRDRSDRIYKFKDNDDEPHFWPKITNIATRKWADWPII